MTSPLVDPRGRPYHQGQAAFSDRVWADPENVLPSAQDRSPFYRRCFEYWSNQAYRRVQEWTSYLARNGLYQDTRPIYSIVYRVVEWWVAQTYPGPLSEDGSKLPEGIESAIPLAEDTDPKLRAAIGQLWQWWGWQAGKDRAVRFAALTGNTLVELIDDLPRSKVIAKVWWPSHVRDIQLDEAGNTKAYRVLERRQDERGEWYDFEREVTNRTITTYKDGDLWDFVNNTPAGPEAVVAHPYGFAPATWWRWDDIGDEYGLPCFWAQLPKVDEVNGLASMIHDQIAKIIKSPVVVNTESAIQRLTEAAAQLKRSPDPTGDMALRRRESTKLIHLPPGSDLKTLPLELGQSLEVLASDIAELEKDRPEIVASTVLRQNPGISGRAAKVLLGDVENLKLAKDALMDQQMIKLHQMAVAMVGEHLKRGDYGRFGKVTYQQELFRPFDLESFDKGLINHDIMPRPLVEITEEEKWQGVKVKVDALNAKATSPGLAIPDKVLQMEAGYTAEDWKQWEDDDLLNSTSGADLGAALLGAFDSGAGVNPQSPSQATSDAATAGDAVAGATMPMTQISSNGRGNGTGG